MSVLLLEVNTRPNQAHSSENIYYLQEVGLRLEGVDVAGFSAISPGSTPRTSLTSAQNSFNSLDCSLRVPAHQT